MELLPNKNGRRRRQRAAANAAPVIADSCCGRIPQECSPNSKGSPLLDRLVRHLGEQPGCDNVGAFESGWANGGRQPVSLQASQAYDGEDSWPPLTNLLRMLDPQKDFHRGASGRLPSVPDLHGRANTNGGAREACRREISFLAGSGVSLEGVTVDDIPMRRRVDHFCSSQSVCNGQTLETPKVHLKEQINSGSFASRSPKRKAQLQQSSNNSQLNLFGEQISEDDKQTSDPRGGCGIKRVQQWGAVGQTWTGDLKVSNEDSEPHDCSAATWSTHSSVRGSTSAGGRPSLRTMSSQESLSDMAQCVCSHVIVFLDISSPTSKISICFARCSPTAWLASIDELPVL